MKEPTRRRSARTPKPNAEKIAPPPAGRSRSRSAAKSSSQPENVQSVSIADNQRKRKRSFSNSEERPKMSKKIVDGRVIDRHCWVCHELSDESGCLSCPRVYHGECLRKLKLSSAAGGRPLSCECKLKTVDPKMEDLALDPRELKTLLQYVTQEAIKEDKKTRPRPAESSKFCRYFQAWPPDEDNLLCPPDEDNLLCPPDEDNLLCPPDEDNLLCRVMDLNILIDNMNGEEPYLSTAQFFLDVKWIYHNCCILYGPHCDISKMALKLEKNFKRELEDMEACPECYNNKYSDKYVHANFFTKVCSNPHPIIWAQLRGYSYWPAKCLKIHNGRADVRFFGTHDKANISVKQCYRISKHPPRNKMNRRAKLQEAICELSIYISNYKTIIGPFPFYNDDTPLEDSEPKKIRRKGRGKNVKRASRTEISSENSETSPTAAVPDSGLSEEFSEPQVKKRNFFDAQIDSKSREQRLLAHFSAAEEARNMCTESAGDLNSDVLCHMTFSADEHNGPANELNASEEIVAASLSFPSAGKTPELPSCSDFVNTTEAEPSGLGFMGAVPIITSAVSTNDIPLDQLTDIAASVQSSDMTLNSMINSISGTFPIITSTSSSCEGGTPRSVPVTTEEQISAIMNGLRPGSSSGSGEVPDLMNGGTAEQLLANDDADNDEEVTVLGERKKGIVQKFFQTPSMMKAVLEIILANYPQMKEIVNYLNAVTVQAILSMWVSFNSSKLENEGSKDIIKFCAQNVRRARTLQRHLNAALQDKAEAERAKGDLEKQVKELSERIEQLTKLSTHKNVLKDSIILKVSEKMRNNTAEQQRRAEEKLREKDQHIRRLEESEDRLRQENESLAAQLQEARLQAEQLQRQLEDRIHQRRDTETQTEVYVSPEREMPIQNQLINRRSGLIVVERNVSSVPGAVIQHVIEQNVVMSERTTITTPSAGVRTTAPSPLVPVSMMVSPMAAPQYPLLLATEGTLNPPKPRLSGQRKTRKHNHS